MIGDQYLKRQPKQEPAEEGRKGYMLLDPSNPASRLLVLVLTKNQITTADAAKELNVTENIVKEWAKILEKQSLLKIKYKLFSNTMVLEA